MKTPSNAQINRNRESARIQLKSRILEWYAAMTGKMPECQCEDQGLWWLEPDVPGVNNPVLSEKFIGDHWTLEIKFREPKIRVFMP